MTKADYPVEKRAVEATVIGDSVKKPNIHEVLPKRDAQESALDTGASHLPRYDPFKPYRPKPEPKPGHGGHCCNTACNFPGCTKWYVHVRASFAPRGRTDLLLARVAVAPGKPAPHRTRHALTGVVTLRLAHTALPWRTS